MFPSKPIAERISASVNAASKPETGVLAFNFVMVVCCYAFA
jgi:hypothetical protein